MTTPVIHCALCNKPVEEVVWFDDFDTGNTVVRAYCHGEVDEMQFNPSALTLAQCKALSQEVGVAFAEKSLTESVGHGVNLLPEKE